MTKVVEIFFSGNYLKVVLQPDQEWKGYSLQDALFIQRMFHLLQFHHLKKTPGKKDTISFVLHTDKAIEKNIILWEFFAINTRRRRP